MKVRYTRLFIKDFEKLPDQIKKRTTFVIDAIKEVNTLREIKNCASLKGYENAYRIRIGDYRIILTNEIDTIIFNRVTSRGEAYKN